MSRLAQTITHLPRVVGAKDSHGRAAVTFGPAVSINVFAVYPRMSEEPNEAGRESTVIGLTVLAPSGVSIPATDRVTFDGLTYEVDGFTANWNHGPFGYAPGVSINLTRVEG